MAKGTAAEVLWKGNDGRLNPIRNNLIRKLGEVCDAIKGLTDEEVIALEKWFPFSELVPSAQAVANAFKVRAAGVKRPVEEPVASKK